MPFFKRWLFNSAFVYCFLFLVLSFPFQVLGYVSPGAPKGFVNDFAGMLSEQERVSLETRLVTFQKNTTNEISVVTISSLGNDTIENVANALFKEWSIGKKGKDNGVLFLIARDDRAVRIEVGYGLEGFLTDAQSNWIIRNTIIPQFQAGNIDKGIEGAVQNIISAVSGLEEIPRDEAPAMQRNRSVGFNWFWFIFFGPMWLASILGRTKSWWLGGVLGGVAGVIIGIVKGFLYTGVIWIGVLVSIGLLFDFIVSRNYARRGGRGGGNWFIGGPWMGGGGSGFGGGFGGFGGGGSGGGGSSGRW